MSFMKTIAFVLIMQTGVPLIAVRAVDIVVMRIFSKMSSRETMPRTSESELAITSRMTFVWDVAHKVIIHFALFRRG